MSGSAAGAGRTGPSHCRHQPRPRRTARRAHLWRQSPDTLPQPLQSMHSQHLRRPRVRYGARGPRGWSRTLSRASAADIPADARHLRRRPRTAAPHYHLPARLGPDAAGRGPTGPRRRSRSALTPYRVPTLTPTPTPPGPPIATRTQRSLPPGAATDGAGSLSSRSREVGASRHEAWI